MDNTKDITKTGPKALKGVRNPDIYSSLNQKQSSINLEELQNKLNRAKLANYNAAHGNLGYQALSKQNLYTPLVNPELDYGSSRYDEGILIGANQQEIGNRRADNLSWLTQASAGILKGTILAGTTFIDGTVGLVAGLGQAAYNVFDGDKNTSFFQGLWDNPVVRAMGELNKLSEETFVNYRTEEEINGPWYGLENMTSVNFWFDTVIKNMGFTVGAALSGGVYTKAIGWAARALGAAKLGRAAQATIQAGMKAAEAKNFTRATKSLVGSVFSAHAEAVQEAYNSSQDALLTYNLSIESKQFELIDLAMLEFINNGGSILADGTPNPASDPTLLNNLNSKLQKIENASKIAKQEAINQSKKVGTMTGILNTLVLSVDNFFMFGKMYAGGWKSARNAHKSVTKATKEAIKDAKAAAKAGDPTKLKNLKALVKKAKDTGYQNLTASEKNMIEEVIPHFLGKKMGVAYNIVKSPVREGNEEMMQGAISQAATYRYGDEADKIFNAQLNIPATYEVRDLLGSLMHGFSNQYGDIDNYEEAFVGAFTGLLGSPTFGKRNNSTDQTYLGRSKWIGLSGGVITDVRDFLRQRNLEDLAAKHATLVLRNDKLASDIKHLIAQTHFNNSMNKAIIHDDEKEYKDARTAAIFEAVAHLRRVNRLDLLQNAMKATTEFTDEDIQQIFESVSREASATTLDMSDLIRLKLNVELRIQDTLEQLDQLLADLFHISDSASNSEWSDQYNALVEEQSSQLDLEITLLKYEKSRIEAIIAQNKPYMISPYIHLDGTVFTIDEIKLDINKRVLSFQKIIDTITDTQAQIDEATSGILTNEQLDTLTWYKVMINDWLERSDSITNTWKSFIENVINDPQFLQALSLIDDIEKILNDAEIDQKDANIQLGGRLDILKRAKSKKTVLEQLQQALSTGGINFAYLLNSTQKLSKSDEPLGDIIYKLLKQVIEEEGTLNLSSDIKATFIKNLDDLKAMGKGHAKYNELLDSYLKNPEKIDKAHQTSIDNTLANVSALSANNVANGIDWNSPAGTIADYLRTNAKAILDAGGFEQFIANLTPELQRKARQALQLIMGLDSMDSLILNTEMEDEHSLILRLLMQNNLNDCDTIELLANAIRDDIRDGAIERIITNMAGEDQLNTLIERQIEAAEIAILEFLDNNLERLAAASEEALRAIDALQLRIEQQAAQATLEEEEARLREDRRASQGNLATLLERAREPETPEVPPLEDPTPTDDDSHENTPNSNPSSSLEVSRINNERYKAPSAGTPGFNRRRLVSQYALQGKDRLTLPEYYRLHQAAIPNGVDPQEFIRYIEAVHKKLVESGAYTYISGVNPELRLKEGQEIKFTTDPKLNEEAGVTVILMVVTDELGHDLIIGSLPTSLEFLAKQRGSNKTLGEANPLDKALYDSLCEELLAKVNNTQNLGESKLVVSSTTTKVESLKRGHPSFSSLNRSVSEVFGNAPIPITIILTNGSRSSTAVDNPLDLIDPVSGQVYVYVTSNTGVQVPLLCVSTKLKDLSNSDWYIKQVAAIVQQFADSLNIGNTKNALLRWLPFLDNLHVNILENRGTRYVVIGHGRDNSGRITTTYSIKIQPDGTITERDAIQFVKNMARKKITLSNGKLDYPTINVDRNLLQNEEYVANISRYIKINITSGSPRTIDDWFTYEPTGPQILHENPDSPNPVVPPSGVTPPIEVLESPGGPIEVSSAGTVTHEDGTLVLDGEDAGIPNNPTPKAEIDDDAKSSSGSPLERAFGGATEDIDFIPDTPNQRRRVIPREELDDDDIPEFMLVPLDSTQEQLASVDVIERNLAKIATMFPKLAKEGRIVLVKGLINIVDSKGNPRQAYGMFKNGVLYVSDQSPNGTAFHEAFHYIVDTLLTSSETEIMFKEASKLWGNLSLMELEEHLAEAFREFINYREDTSIKGKLKNMFLTLKHIVLSIVGKEHYLDNLFWGIYRNNMQNRTDNTAEDTFKQELLEYKINKLKYSNLDLETKNYLAARKFSEENYEKLSIEQKETLLLCM